MLKSRYNEILIGLNVTSLIRGLISLKNNKSVLLIDDSSFKSTGPLNDFVSELEVQSFLRQENTINIGLKELPGNTHDYNEHDLIYSLTEDLLK